MLGCCLSGVIEVVQAQRFGRFNTVKSAAEWKKVHKVQVENQKLLDAEKEKRQTSEEVDAFSAPQEARSTVQIQRTAPVDNRRRIPVAFLRPRANRRPAPAPEAATNTAAPPPPPPQPPVIRRRLRKRLRKVNKRPLPNLGKKEEVIFKELPPPPPQLVEEEVIAIVPASAAPPVVVPVVTTSRPPPPSPTVTPRLVPSPTPFPTVSGDSLQN